MVSTPRAPRRRTLFYAWVIVCLVPIAPICVGQSYKAGEDIEVLFLGEWRPGVVVDTNKRGDVLADFQFGATGKREAFKRADVRYAYESGALTRARTWSDASGNFNTKAALLAIKDNDTIVIRKPDMAELTIPLSKLSEADQKYINSLKRAGGIAVMTGPELPPLETFGESAFSAFAASFSGQDTQRSALTPDPVPSFLKLKQGAAAFPLEHDRDRLGAVLPLGGQDIWLLAAIENDNPFATGLPTRLVWVSLARQKVEGRQLLTPGEMVIDYHPPTRRLLTRGVIKSEDQFADLPPEFKAQVERRKIGDHLARRGIGTATLTLWEVSPSDKQVKPIVRWLGGDSSTHDDAWARIVDGTIVIERHKTQEYVAWDTSAKEARYRLAQESFFAPIASLSHGRKYLFLPEDKGVRIIEAATGNLLTTLPAVNGASGVALSEDGRRLAVLEDYELAIWDLTDPQSTPQRYEAQAIGSPFRAQLFWVGDQRVMSDSGLIGHVLFSLKTKIALWNYHFDWNAVREERGRRLREIIDRHLVYAAKVSSGRQEGLAVGAVQLPGPKVDEVEASVDPESLYIIKPGTQVRLQVQTGEHDARVRKALEGKIKSNGWALSPSATIVVSATMGQSETQTVTYSSGGFFGRAQSTQSVSVTPFYSSLQIKVGDQVAWSSGTSTGAPPILHLREGETAQSEVSKWQNPNPGFFDQVEIPVKIMDPSKKNGLGTTEVTNRGLVPK